MIEEFSTKQARIRALLDQEQADGLLLRRVSSFAWATCGAESYVNTATTEGAASLLITREHRYLVTNNIEAPRLAKETQLLEQGWEFNISHWASPLLELKKLTSGLNLIADVPFADAKEVSAALARLRANLTDSEGQRFSVLAQACAQAMDSAIRAVRPQMTEYQIAALLGYETQKLGIQPVVNLIATDERIYNFRHPLPTGKKLQKYALLVLSGRRAGLVCSISRLIHFGPIPADLQHRILSTAQVNAALIAHTRPGRTLDQVFLQGQHEYANVGFADEWRLHHQGGALGYEPREYLGMPGATDVVLPGQVFAWNPSIAGAKMEDSILVGPQYNKILTTIPGWPIASVQVPGMDVSIECPLALQIT